MNFDWFGNRVRGRQNFIGSVMCRRGQIVIGGDLILDMLVMM